MVEFIYIPSGSDRIHSYSATPDEPNGCCIVLGSAVWGLNFDMVDFAECYAALGYTVLAPNLFWREVPEHAIDYDFTQVEFVHGLAERGSDDEGMSDLRAAGEFLRTQKGCSKVGMLGWCYGGRLACRLAVETTFESCIGVYPTFLEKHLGIAGTISRPLTIHIPENDAFASADAPKIIPAAFKDDPMVETFVYSNAGHGFDFAPPHRFANHAAARLCDSRIIRFFDKTLLGADGA